jgi:hypothetical protein
VGEVVNRSFPVSIPPFLSFITEVFAKRVGLVPESEYWSALFMIVACVWKALDIIICH